MKVFKFYPSNRAKFHFGDSTGKLKEIFSSDQLFSAFFNCAVLLYGAEQAEEFLSRSLDNLIFSSLLYGMSFVNQANGQSKELFFLPRPLAPIEEKDGPQDLLNHKKTKKIKYLSVGVFSLLQSYWQSDGEWFNYNLLNCALLGERFACTHEEIEPLGLDRSSYEKIKLFTTDAKPRVVVLRSDDKAGNFYYQEETEVTYQQIGDVLIRPFMYFFCRGEIERWFMAVIRLMADEGLGGKRSLGMGALGEVVTEEWPEEMLAGGGDYFMSLSSVYPRPDEVDKLVYYDLAERSGYMYSQQGRSLRKKRVRILKEGSIFSGQVSGDLIDIRPDAFGKHKVFLNGKAFLIPAGEERS